MSVRLPLVVALAVVLPAIVFVLPALAGCGGSVTDANEPNDELAAATVLTPGIPVDGVLGSDDADVFQCDVPGVDTADDNAGQDAEMDAGQDAERRPFVVTVTTDSPDDLELEVGASLPDSWEGISWPGWDTVVKGDRLEVSAALADGTVIMVLTGESGSEYSIEIVWD
jgi:hypothetical protein